MLWRPSVREAWELKTWALDLNLACSLALSRMCSVVCVNLNLSLCLSVCISHWNTHTHTNTHRVLRVRVVVPSSHWGLMQQEVLVCLLACCHGLFLYKCLTLFSPCITFLWRACNSVCACVLLIKSHTCGFSCVCVCVCASVFVHSNMCDRCHREGANIVILQQQTPVWLVGLWWTAQWKLIRQEDVCCVITVSVWWHDEVVDQSCCLSEPLHSCVQFRDVTNEKALWLKRSQFLLSWLTIVMRHTVLLLSVPDRQNEL